MVNFFRFVSGLKDGIVFVCVRVFWIKQLFHNHTMRGFFFLLLPIDEQIIGNRGLYFLLGATLVVLATKKQPFSLDLVAHDEYVSLHRGIVN